MTSGTAAKVGALQVLFHLEVMPCTHFSFGVEHCRFPKYFIILILSSFTLLIGVFVTRQFIDRITSSDNTCGLYSAVLGLYLGGSGYIMYTPGC